jgi:UDP-N-acetylmuramoylalanine--D-glutamate ligase
VIDGIAWYDDSASTIPEATLAALVELAPVATLICGGHDRDVDQRPLAEGLRRVPHVILLPETGAEIARHLQPHPDAHEVATLTEAVALARRITPSGGRCLFSPAAASYHAFRDFEHRGQVFQDLVRGDHT